MKKTLFKFVAPLFALVVFFSANVEASTSASGGSEIVISESARVGDDITISFYGEVPRHIKVRMFTPTGDIIREFEVTNRAGSRTISIPTDQLSFNGVYTVVVRTHQGQKQVTKVSVTEADRNL
ncbi:MAG: hypothetical protein ACI959_000027 [Limisphaerales bacterium]|jgi:hypothetical protein